MAFPLIFRIRVQNFLLRDEISSPAVHATPGHYN